MPKQTKFPDMSTNTMAIKPAKPTYPLWKGPEVDGITQSILSRFLVCRERFRIYALEGLQPRDTFRHALEYGTMWHLCQEAYGKGTDWEGSLADYTDTLCRRYPLQQEQVMHWARVCEAQFSVYATIHRHTDLTVHTTRQHLLTEQVFDVPYHLTSGHTVRLRGKWDGVDLMESITKIPSSKGIWLVEHKTKGEVDTQSIERQLKFDLQTMLYAVALQHTAFRDATESCWEGPLGGGTIVSGVLYNVIRRPLAGGLHSIVRHKPSKSNPRGESSEEFYARLGRVIAMHPEHYFYHWQVTITHEDILHFRRECLDPVLKQLCTWWEYMLAYDKIIDDYTNIWGYNSGLHWRIPYGVYGLTPSDEYADYLATGSEVGLERVTNLFPELTTSN